MMGAESPPRGPPRGVFYGIFAFGVSCAETLSSIALVVLGLPVLTVLTWLFPTLLDELKDLIGADRNAPLRDGLARAGARVPRAVLAPVLPSGALPPLVVTPKPISPPLVVTPKPISTKDEQSSRDVPAGSAQSAEGSSLEETEGGKEGESLALGVSHGEELVTAAQRWNPVNKREGAVGSDVCKEKEQGRDAPEVAVGGSDLKTAATAVRPSANGLLPAQPDPYESDLSRPSERHKSLPQSEITAPAVEAASQPSTEQPDNPEAEREPEAGVSVAPPNDKTPDTQSITESSIGAPPTDELLEAGKAMGSIDPAGRGALSVVPSEAVDVPVKGPEVHSAGKELGFSLSDLQRLIEEEESEMGPLETEGPPSTPEDPPVELQPVPEEKGESQHSEDQQQPEVQEHPAASRGPTHLDELSANDISSRARTPGEFEALHSERSGNGERLADTFYRGSNFLNFKSSHSDKPHRDMY